MVLLSNKNFRCSYFLIHLKKSCRSADLRFRVKRRSRRKRAKTAFRSVFTVRPSGQAAATEKCKTKLVVVIWES